MIFRQQSHNLVWLRVPGKRSEITKVTKDHGDDGALRVEQSFLAWALHKLGDLRRKESLQAVDPFGPLLGQRQFSRHCVEALGQPLQFVAGTHLDPVIELSCTDMARAVLERLDRPNHPPGEPISERCCKGHAGQQQEPGAPERRADRLVSFGCWQGDDRCPIGTFDPLGGSRDRAAFSVGAADKSAAALGSRDLERAQRGGRWIVLAAQDQADVRMGDEFPGMVQHEGLSGLADVDGGNDIPNELQIDLGDRRACARTYAGDGDGHKWFGAAMQRDRSPPEALRPRADKSWIGGMIDPAHFDIGICARYAKPLTARAVDKHRLDDRGGLAHQSKHVDAVAVVETLAPRGLDRPIHLAGNPVEELLNARGCRVRFRAKVQVQRMPLVEVAEPRFARAAR